MIDHYATGKMTIEGKTHHNDLKIINGKVKGNWWRKEGHRLRLEDIEDILSAKPSILVIGMGYAGHMKIPSSLKRELEQKNIRLYAENTNDAVKMFNHLFSQNKAVAGAFHLTC